MRPLLAIALLSVFSCPAFACWNLRASGTLGGEELKIDQKINHGQTYSFAKGHYILHIMVPSDFKMKGISLKVDERQGTSLTHVSNARVMIKENESARLTTENTNGHINDITINLTAI